MITTATETEGGLPVIILRYSWLSKVLANVYALYKWHFPSFSDYSGNHCRLISRIVIKKPTHHMQVCEAQTVKL